MKIADPAPMALTGAPQLRRARSPEEAAAQFEEVLVKQLVKTMTDGLFKTSLAGEGGLSSVGAYNDMQKDVLAEELSRHLIQSGTLRISDMLLRQWKQSGLADPEPAGSGPEAPNPKSQILNGGPEPAGKPIPMPSPPSSLPLV